MTSTNHLERLPWELLENIIERLPRPDILRVTQVTRGFRDSVRHSPLIQHELDLYATGLEPNRATVVTVADSIKALGEYRSRWKDFNIDPEHLELTARISSSDREATAGGVYGVATEREIQFFTLPSSLRGIQPKRQSVSLDFNIFNFAFHPHADVVVVAGHAGFITKFSLMTMSEGLPHPSAHEKIIYVMGSSDIFHEVLVSITSHRLASTVLNRDEDALQLNVWDWRTGEQLFTHDNPHYGLLGFLDDYRLAVEMRPSSDKKPLRLLLLDTEQVSSGMPVQTWFHAPMAYRGWSWVIEAGGHKPSPQDILTAPFYPDPSQRILAFSLGSGNGMSVMKVETLLRLSRERTGGKVQWKEWKPYLLETFLEREPHESDVRSWVSGFRLFRLPAALDDTCDLYVYDFSARGRMSSLRQPAGNDRQVRMYPSVRRCWKDINMCDTNVGHDSVVFLTYPDEQGNRLHIQSI